MDFQFPSLLFLLSFLFFLFMLVKLFTRNKRLVNLPPGPRPLPMIGNLHQLIGKLPHHAFREMSKTYGPLMSLRLGEIQWIVVSSASIAEEILRTNNLVFAQRPFTLPSNELLYDSTDGIFCPYGTYSNQMRKISTMQLLSTKAVAFYQTIREEEVANMINEIKAAHIELPTLNLSSKVTSYMYRVMGKVTAGYKFKDLAKIIKICKKTFRLVLFNVSDMYPSVTLIQAFCRYRIKQMKADIDEMLSDIVDGHRRRKLKEDEKEDLVDALLRVQKDADHELDSPLTDNNIKAIIGGILVAGGDTSSTIVEWTMSELLRKPQIMKRVQTEVREAFNDTGIIDELKLSNLKYLQAIIKESLRLHPFIPVLRESIEESVVAGYTIPAKAWVLINTWAIARDSKHWTEPEIFKPERFLESKVDFRGTNFEYIPFGAGRRSCPGITFGLSNIQIVLSNLLYHFDWSLPDGMRPEELDMTEEPGMITKRNDLIVVAKPYLP